MSAKKEAPAAEQPSQLDPAGSV